MRRLASEPYDALVHIISDENPRDLEGVDPARQVIASRAGARLFHEQLRRTDAGSVQVCVTLLRTPGLAQQAAMAVEAYEQFVLAACHLDDPDPLAA